MINRINEQATSNYLAFSAGQNSKRSHKAENATSTQSQTSVNTGVKVDISEEAMKISLQLKEYGTKSHLKLDEDFFKQDLREQRKLDFAKGIAERGEIDTFNNEFQLLGVTYNFNDGTLEKFISDTLDDKAKNASLVASELGQMIRGTVYNPDATVEESAINRETALKNAEHIAQNYFDDPDEAKTFLDEINRYAENDILREKGYVIFDNSNMEAFKSYTLPNAPDGYIRGSEYAKKFGESSMLEIFENPQKFEAFVKSVNSNASKWKDEIVKSFDENKNKVADIISKIKNSLNETDVDNSLQRLLKAF